MGVPGNRNGAALEKPVQLETANVESSGTPRISLLWTLVALPLPNCTARYRFCSASYPLGLSEAERLLGYHHTTTEAFGERTFHGGSARQAASISRYHSISWLSIKDVNIKTAATRSYGERVGIKTLGARFRVTRSTDREVRMFARKTQC